VPLQLGFCRSTNRRFGAFKTGFLSQSKPAVRYLYGWISFAVQTGGSVRLQLVFCRSRNRRFGAFTTGFLSQYKPAVRCLLQQGLCRSTNRRFFAYRTGFHVPVQTVDLAFCPSTRIRFNAFTIWYLSQFRRTIKYP